MNIDYNYKTNEFTVMNTSAKIGECNHNPNSLDTTLVKFNKIIMTTPGVINFICSKCGKSFKFIRRYKNYQEYQEYQEYEE